MSRELTNIEINDPEFFLTLKEPVSFLSLPAAQLEWNAFYSLNRLEIMPVQLNVNTGSMESRNSITKCLLSNLLNRFFLDEKKGARKTIEIIKNAFTEFKTTHLIIFGGCEHINFQNSEISGCINDLRELSSSLNVKLTFVIDSESGRRFRINNSISKSLLMCCGGISSELGVRHFLNRFDPVRHHIEPRLSDIKYTSEFCEGLYELTKGCVSQMIISLDNILYVEQSRPEYSGQLSLGSEELQRYLAI